MADAPTNPDEAEVRARWGAFAWSDESREKRNAILAHYPAGHMLADTTAILGPMDIVCGECGR